MRHWEDSVLRNNFGNRQRATGMRAAIYVAWCLVPLAFTVSAHAAVYCAIPGGRGAQTGSDWNNACNGFSGACKWSALARGDVLYFAGNGLVSTHYQPQGVVSTPVSGTTLITIKGATASDHGTNTGWTMALGVDSSPAIWDLGTSPAGQNFVIFTSGYWDISGQGVAGTSAPTLTKRSDPTQYGIRITPPTSCPTNQYVFFMGDSSGQDTSHITFEYISADFTGCGTASVSRAITEDQGQGTHGNDTNRYLYCAGCQGIVNHRYGSGTQTANNLDEYLYGVKPFNDGTHHGEQINCFGCANLTIRYTYLENCVGTACITANDDEGGHDNPSIYNSAVYGNIFNGWTSGNGALASTTRSSIQNTVVYNNTFTNGQGGPWFACVSCASGSGNTVENNLVYNMSAVLGNGVTTNDYNAYYSATNVPSETHGQTASGNPFVSSATGDLHLTAATASGLSLSTPYNTDADGNTRGADGTWDRGAYEFTSGATLSACDLNGDSLINVSDVQLCVNQAIGSAACTTGDINKDGVCNVIDVQRDVNAALGGQCVTQ